MSFILTTILLTVAALIGLFLGRWLERSGKWVYCDDALPASKNYIENYPVAFFDKEFGIVHDQAEYHGRRLPAWRSVPDGTPVHPYAWFDLPSAPHPRRSQDMGSVDG